MASEFGRVVLRVEVHRDTRMKYIPAVRCVVFLTSTVVLRSTQRDSDLSRLSTRLTGAITCAATARAAAEVLAARAATARAATWDAYGLVLVDSGRGCTGGET